MSDVKKLLDAQDRRRSAVESKLMQAVTDQALRQTRLEEQLSLSLGALTAQMAALAGGAGVPQPPLQAPHRDPSPKTQQQQP